MESVEMPNLLKLEQPLENKKKHNFKLNLKKITQPNSSSKNNQEDKLKQDTSKEQENIVFEREKKVLNNITA